MNIIVYQIKTRHDGSKSIEPVALFSKLGEAKKFMGKMLARDKEVYGTVVSPLKVNKISNSQIERTD
jgi:hypothetical protein